MSSLIRPYIFSFCSPNSPTPAAATGRTPAAATGPTSSVY